MTGSIPYWHVDAFADRPFSGNQAAVMLLDRWPHDELLQAIAEENNLAETAFLVADAGDAADWELRWFTPACEVRLCGHATLAAGHVLLQSDREASEVRFRTRRAGVLDVRRLAQGYELKLPAIATQPASWPEAEKLLGATPLECWSNPDGYTIFLFEDEAAVRGLRPDLPGLAVLGEHQFICTAEGSESDVVSRVFVPGAGVPEDSVTGSAHAALTPFWAARLGRMAFSACQASARGGRLACRLEGDGVWLGGQCFTVMEARFRLGEG